MILRIMCAACFVAGLANVYLWVAAPPRSWINVVGAAVSFGVASYALRVIRDEREVR